jgi:hypothetical protein
MSKRMRCVTVFIGGIIGLVLGIFTAYLVDNGYFVRWQKILPSSQKATELGPLGDSAFYIKITDNNYYYVSRPRHELRGPLKELPDSCNNCIIPTPCVYSSTEFSILANHPVNVITCFHIQLYIDNPEIWTSYTIALDRKGNCWDWSFNNFGYLSLGLFCFFPLIGLIIGAVIGIILISQHRKSKQQTNNP